MKNSKLNPKKVTYIQLIARRVSNLLGRDLTPKEWGILGTLAKTQDTFIISDVLSIYEDPTNKLSLKGVPHLFYVVKQSSNIDAFDIEDLREAIIETKEFQEKGKQLLTQLLQG